MSEPLSRVERILHPTWCFGGEDFVQGYEAHLRLQLVDGLQLRDHGAEPAEHHDKLRAWGLKIFPHVNNKE